MPLSTQGVGWEGEEDEENDTIKRKDGGRGGDADKWIRKKDSR